MAMTLIACLLGCCVLVVWLGAAVIMDDGLTEEANDIAGGQFASLTVHLYTNNHTPAIGDTTAAYTEATFPGYAAQAMGTPTVGAITGNTIPLTWGPFTWTSTGTSTESVFGYYVTNSAGALKFAEKFAAGPYDFTALGTSLTLTVTESLTRV